MITIFEGVAAYTAIEMFIVQIYYLFTGIVLTLSFTSLSENFQSHPSVNKAKPEI